METITDEVTQIICKQLNISSVGLTPDTVLQGIGIESLDLVEIVFALEEEFDISIPYNANVAAAAGNGELPIVGSVKLDTIAHISAAVKELMDAKMSA